MKAGDIVRRNSDGAHAEVIGPPDNGVMVVRYGVEGSRFCAPGVRAIRGARVDEFTKVRDAAATLQHIPVRK